MLLISYCIFYLRNHSYVAVVMNILRFKEAKANKSQWYVCIINRKLDIEQIGTMDAYIKISLTIAILIHLN